MGTVSAHDLDDVDDVRYGISGGPDASSFEIGEVSGQLVFRDAPDFENPASDDGDNVYEVTVTATSGTGDRELTATQAVTVTVTDAAALSEGERLSFVELGDDGTLTVPLKGEPLTVDVSAVMEQAERGSLSYWWIRERGADDRAGLGHAGESSYRPTAHDVGARLMVEVNFTDLDGQRRRLSTDLTDEVRERHIGDDLASAATGVRGIWGNDVTVWVADIAASQPRLLAFDRATQRRNESKDISSVADNDAPYGIWSDGQTMWVADTADVKVYAYSLAGGADFGSRTESDEFDLDDANADPRGMWGDGETLWVANSGGGGDGDGAAAKLFAYNLDTGSRDAEKDFDDLADVGQAAGIWSDGRHTMWVIDADADAGYARAYALSDGSRQSGRDIDVKKSRDIDLEEANMSLSPAGAWGDADELTLWVTDRSANTVFRYSIPAPADLLEAVRARGQRRGDGGRGAER